MCSNMGEEGAPAEDVEAEDRADHRGLELRGRAPIPLAVEG